MSVLETLMAMRKYSEGKMVDGNLITPALDAAIEKFKTADNNRKLLENYEELREKCDSCDWCIKSEHCMKCETYKKMNKIKQQMKG